jgi:hypothetical protein
MGCYGKQRKTDVPYVKERITYVLISLKLDRKEMK